MKTSTLFNVKALPLEHVFQPIAFFTVLHDGKPLTFFDGLAFDNSNGDTIIPVKYNNEFRWIKLGWEPDCDGSYYYYSFMLEDDMQEAFDNFEYNPQWDYRVNIIDIYKHFAPIFRAAGW